MCMLTRPVRSSSRSARATAARLIRRSRASSPNSALPCALSFRNCRSLPESLAILRGVLPASSSSHTTRREVLGTSGSGGYTWGRLPRGNCRSPCHVFDNAYSGDHRCCTPYPTPLLDSLLAVALDVAPFGDGGMEAAPGVHWMVAGFTLLHLRHPLARLFTAVSATDPGSNTVASCCVRRDNDVGVQIEPTEEPTDHEIPFLSWCVRSSLYFMESASYGVRVRLFPFIRCGASSPPVV